MREVIIDLIRGSVVKGLVRSLLVVKPKPVPESFPKFGSVVEGSQVKVMILECPPQSLDEDVVLDASPTVHADLDSMVF